MLDDRSSSGRSTIHHPTRDTRNYFSYCLSCLFLARLSRWVPLVLSLARTLLLRFRGAIFSTTEIASSSSSFMEISSSITLEIPRQLPVRQVGQFSIAAIASLRADDRSRCMTIFTSKPFHGPQWGTSDLDIATPRTFLPFCILLVHMHIKTSLKSSSLWNEILRAASGYPGFAALSEAKESRYLGGSPCFQGNRYL